MNNNIFVIALVLVTGLILSGCTQNRSAFDERILASATDLSETAADLKRGEELIEDGNAAIKKGERQVEDGNERIAEGRSQVEEGRALVEKARRDYCSRTGYRDQSCL